MVIQFPATQRRSRSLGGTSYDEFALPAMGDEVIGASRRCNIAALTH